MAHKKRRGLWLDWEPQSRECYRVRLYRHQYCLGIVTVSPTCFNVGSIWALIAAVLGELWQRLDGTYSVEDRFNRLWDEAVETGALRGLSTEEAQAVCDHIWAQAVRG